MSEERRHMLEVIVDNLHKSRFWDYLTDHFDNVRFDYHEGMDEILIYGNLPNPEILNDMEGIIHETITEKIQKRVVLENLQRLRDQTTEGLLGRITYDSTSYITTYQGLAIAHGPSIDGAIKAGDPRFVRLDQYGDYQPGELERMRRDHEHEEFKYEIRGTKEPKKEEPIVIHIPFDVVPVHPVRRYLMERDLWTGAVRFCRNQEIDMDALLNFIFKYMRNGEHPLDVARIRPLLEEGGAGKFYSTEFHQAVLGTGLPENLEKYKAFLQLTKVGRRAIELAQKYDLQDRHLPLLYATSARGLNISTNMLELALGKKSASDYANDVISRRYGRDSIKSAGPQFIHEINQAYITFLPFLDLLTPKDTVIEQVTKQFDDFLGTERDYVICTQIKGYENLEKFMSKLGIDSDRLKHHYDQARDGVVRLQSTMNIAILGEDDYVVVDQRRFHTHHVNQSFLDRAFEIGRIGMKEREEYDGRYGKMPELSGVVNSTNILGDFEGKEKQLAFCFDPEQGLRAYDVSELEGRPYDTLLAGPDLAPVVSEDPSLNLALGNEILICEHSIDPSLVAAIKKVGQGMMERIITKPQKINRHYGEVVARESKRYRELVEKETAEFVGYNLDPVVLKHRYKSLTPAEQNLAHQAVASFVRILTSDEADKVDLASLQPTAAYSRQPAFDILLNEFEYSPEGALRRYNDLLGFAIGRRAQTVSRDEIVEYLGLDWNLCVFSTSNSFPDDTELVGHGDLLASLASTVPTNDLTVIGGISGIGKTVLAYNLYQQLREEGIESYWLQVGSSSSDRSVINGLINALAEAGKPELKERCERIVTGLDTRLELLQSELGDAVLFLGGYDPERLARKEAPLLHQLISSQKAILTSHMRPGFLNPSNSKHQEVIVPELTPEELKEALQNSELGKPYQVETQEYRYWLSVQNPDCPSSPYYGKMYHTFEPDIDSLIKRYGSLVLAYASMDFTEATKGLKAKYFGHSGVLRNSITPEELEFLRPLAFSNKPVDAESVRKHMEGKKFGTRFQSACDTLAQKYYIVGEDQGFRIPYTAVRNYVRDHTSDTDRWNLELSGLSALVVPVLALLNQVGATTFYSPQERKPVFA